jgi:ketosteroid isomerase-like protein
MIAPTTPQTPVLGLPEAGPGLTDDDLAHLRTAYAAINDGDLGPIAGLLDADVHLRGADHGRLWWKTHRTWNGPGEVTSELARRCASPDSPTTRTQTCAGEPTPMGGRFIVEYQTPARGPAGPGHGDNVDFHEVVTMRAGKIMRLADYRSKTAARVAAVAAS